MEVVGPKILVIDDSRDTRDLCRDFLPRYIEGAEILCAENGEEGLEVAREQNPDVVLLDANMPTIDGFETCRRLRSDSITASTPIIMVSAVLMNQEHKRLGLQHGADGYICKPFDNEEVAAQIKALLRIKRYEDDLRKRQESLERSVVDQEVRLQKRASEVQSLFDHSPDAILVEDLDGTLLDVNPAACQLHHMTRDELIGKNMLDLVPPDQRETVAAEFPKWATASLRTYEGYSYTSDGQSVPVEMRSTPITYKGGPAILLHIRNITARKQSEEKLRLSSEALERLVSSRTNELKATEETFHSIVEKSVDGIIVADATGIVLYANNAAAGLFEKPLNELLGHDFGWHIVPGKTSEIDIARSEGDIAVIEMTMADTLWEDTRACLIMLRDISQRRRVEDKLIQAQKLESVGMLAGGIAHDFNNILTGIIGNLSFVRVGQATPEAKMEAIAEAERSAQRAKLLTQQLLTFAKGGSPVKETASIGEILKESSQFVLTGSKSTCRFRVDDNLWAARVDRGQISQVIENLVINADQAMPRGGTVTISASNLTLTEDAPEMTPLLKSGEYVRIRVQDEGTGIPEHHIRKVFDPYFTTKRKGSGLGLATAYSIVRQHDGDVFCESVLNEGTVFTILLPATQEKPVSIEANGTGSLVGEGRVLVMDDESVVRTVAYRMLTSLGYRPVCCANGEDALVRYKEGLDGDDPFACVILDLTVPGGMGGEAALQALQEIDPNVKTIVSSGYADVPAIADPTAYGFQAAVSKPYNIQRLGTAVREVLEPAESPGEPSQPTPEG